MRKRKEKNPSKYNTNKPFYWVQIINFNLNLELLLQDGKEKKICQNTMLPNLFDWDQMSIATSRQNVKIISEEK